MKTSLSIALSIAALFLVTSVEAQTLAKFQSANLEVSGGDVIISNTAAAIYSGRVNISSTGTISGTINRRNFANNATNSVPTTATIQANASRIFGPIANEGSFTNVYAGDYSRTTNIETLYRADFYIATSIANFFIKGRATQRATRTIEVYDDGESTYATTNNYTSVSLGGAAFGAGQARGIFDAD